MAKQVLNNGETHGVIRGKINENFTELYNKAGNVEAINGVVKGNGAGAYSAAKAIDLPITDAGGYFTGTEVETALQEAGASIASNTSDITAIKPRQKNNEALSVRTAKKTVNPSKHTKQVAGFNIVNVPNNANGQFSGVSLKGNSLNQLANNGTSYVNWNLTGTGTTKGATGIHLVALGTTEVAKLPVNLKASTQYTLVYRVIAQNIDGTFRLDVGTGSVLDTPINSIPKNVGFNKQLFTTASTCVNGNTINLNIAGGTDGTYIDVTDIMVFEGDQTTNPLTSYYVSYGTKSTLSFRARSVGKNLLDITKSLGFKDLVNLSASTGTYSMLDNKTGEIEIRPTVPNSGLSYQYKVKESTAYRLSLDSVNVNASSAAGRVNFLDANGTIKRFAVIPSNATTTYATQSVDATTQSGEVQINVTIGCGATAGTVKFKKVQLEQNTVATTYELYTLTEAYFPDSGKSVGTAKDEIRLNAQGQWEKGQKVKDKVLQASDVTAMFTGYTNLDVAMVTKPSDYVDYGVSANSITKYTLEGYSGLNDADSLANIGTTNGNNTTKFLVGFAKGTTLAQAQTALTGKTLSYQLVSEIVTAADVVGKLVVYPTGTVFAEPSLFGFMTGVAKKVITTTAVPILAVRKVIRYDVSATGNLVETDVTSSVTVGDSNTSLTIADVDLTKTYFYDCSYASELSTALEMVFDVEVDSGIISHDYGASAAAWTLTSNESKATMLKCTNAGGAANIIAEPIDGHMYVINNTSGQALTIKTASSTGVTVANTKTATVIYNGSDYIKIAEV